jgi:glycosyltransferase involved in cell wall biosynthesis
MGLPLVSILIPSYKTKYFELTLKSAIAQSYENIEIIVSDDCPDDGIEKIVNRYLSIESISYQRNPKPDGLGMNNANNLLKLARGEYIKYLFDDDVLMPFAVQYMVEAFIKHVAINPRLVVSERWFIDAENGYLGKNRLSDAEISDITELAGARFMAISLSNKLGEFSTAMWRREDSFDSDGHPLFLKLNGRDIEWLVDVVMWIHMAQRGRVLYIGLPLSCFRRHAESNTYNANGLNRARAFTEWEDIVDFALEMKLITLEEALTSYKALSTGYRNKELIEKSLVGHAERLNKKIDETKDIY